MSRVGRFPLFALLICSCAAALGACQALAGISDRRFVAGGDAGAADSDSGPSAACQEYCAQADAICPDPLAPSGMPSSTLYISDVACLQTCALLTPGDPSTPPKPKPGDNTVACRDVQLGFAQSLAENPTQKASYCANAGPGGNDTCGSNCESYCQLYRAACQDWWTVNVGPVLPQAQFDQDTCVSKCQGLKDTQTFSASPYDTSSSSNYQGDTLECRLVHASAATHDPMTHCIHAELQPQPMTPCQDMTGPADCAAFCQLEMTECTDDQKIYQSLDQCLAVCNALPAGTPGDTTGNTVACRKYHSYNALFDAPTHCQHTGPGSEGLCESAKLNTPAAGNCESYCLLLKQACPSDFEDEATCEKDCAKVPAAPSAGYSYSVAPGLPSTAPGLPPTGEPTGNNVECRLLHVSRALSDPTECAAAEGTVAPCM
jgi:hypothetical protein